MDRENEETTTGSQIHRGTAGSARDRSGTTEFERHVAAVAAPTDEPLTDEDWESQDWGSGIQRPQYGRSMPNRFDSPSAGFGRQSLGDMVSGMRDFGRRHPMALIGGAVFAGLLIGVFARSGRERSSEYYGTHPDEIGDDMRRMSSRPGMSGFGRWSRSQPSRPYGRYQDEMATGMDRASSETAGTMGTGEGSGTAPSRYRSPHQDDSGRPLGSGSNTGVGGPL